MRFQHSILVATVLMAATSTAAWAGGASLPQATLSDYYSNGGVAPSNGVDPVFGTVDAGFQYGGEAGTGTQTTVVDFTLPTGVSLVSDPECSGLGFGNLCVLIDGTCSWSTTDPTKQITSSGSTISFRVACDVSEYFEFEIYVASLLTNPGTYGTSFQFKTTTLKRAKSPINMWQIKIPGSFEVGAP